jgi:hypothetical protein
VRAYAAVGRAGSLSQYTRSGVRPSNARCHPHNEVKLGFVEGLNNKIRVIQRRACGYRDEKYLLHKILTAFLPRK